MEYPLVMHLRNCNNISTLRRIDLDINIITTILFNVYTSSHKEILE